jgi:hypothetical protein
MDSTKKERLRAALVNLLGFGGTGGASEQDMDEVVEAIASLADGATDDPTTCPTCGHDLSPDSRRGPE